MMLVFNELSMDKTAPSLHDARERMTSVSQAVAKLAAGRTVSLVAVECFDIYGALLAEGYTLSQWLGDRDVDRDRRNYLRTILTKLHLDKDVSEAVRDRFSLSEFHSRNREARGLGLAYLLDTAALSLPSEEYWRQANIGLRHIWLESDGTERKQDIEVINLSEMEHVQFVADAINKKSRERLRERPGAADRKLADSFPHLEFGLDVKKQVIALPNDIWPCVVTKLTVLDGAVRDWRRSGAQEPVLPEVHPESQATMRRYGHRRNFKGASGREESFPLHAMLGSSYRIHFRIVKKDKTLEIGYIGEHLPTVTFH
ncbi:MAG: hypothetical protein OXU54_02180 [Gammaproteobacteria bacterium]|nr:hypothetical protein [Gammaproteobacteria bacterium]